MRTSLRDIRTLVIVFQALAGLLPGHTAGQLPKLTRDPDSARLEFQDVDRFARAHARLAATSDTIALLDTAYLARATPGLRVYAGMYDVTALALKRALRSYPGRYALAAAHAGDSTRAISGDVRRAMGRLSELYPPAVFPPVYYLVGPQRAGGAVQREGVFIAVETYAQPVGPGGASGFRRLTHLVAHELVHYQQAAFNVELYQQSNTLLARSIKEGVADFIAELVSGSHINPAAHQYGEQHELALWDRFRREMYGTDTGEWFFADPADPAMPRDLGYFMGYRIARSRFRKEVDPAAGVAALIRIDDYEEFLRASGYEEDLAARRR